MDVTVLLEKQPNQTLGIGFKKLSRPPYCQISKLVPGAATQSGKVCEGDVLLGVNGQNVQHLSPDEVREVLSRYSNDTRLLIELRRVSVDTVPNGVVPSINVGVTSPERKSPDFNGSSESSPDASPRLSDRPRRRGRSGINDSSMLPGIQEGNPPPGLFPSHLQEKRHSLTPEPSRKTHVTNPMKTAKTVELTSLPQWRQAMEQVPIQNLIDGHELHDRLHNQELKYKNTGCHPTHCLGSHMWPKAHKPKRPYSHPRPKEEVISLAEDFIKQYYESTKVALGSAYEEKMQARIKQVRAEIEEKGHYDLTYEELVFGARTAWRNAPRCVNRIVWRQLEVLDARDASTPKEMFDAICHHIKYANNGGNLRSTITVFPHRTKPNADFRVWNSQLIRYAGYKNPDGSILGDPSNVEFTELCVRLGWRSPAKKSQFDILPLVLQAYGGEPQLFEIPNELVLEAGILHPQYDWFKDLGLKWYALPAVSCLLLDVGGIEFPGAPFSGWYMGTEIGRDLGDVNRYNLLKPIAQKMGINVQTDKLWKDKAMVELNSAILYSFQKVNFSVVDHHSATESFITHMKAETKARGGCPADWVWIVPPISGSITPVFHQEMLLYHLSPSYEYQDEPWKHHHFPAAHGQGTRERSGSLNFKSLAKLVGRTATMFHHVWVKRVKATILFATETGRARNYATVVNDVFNRVFAAKVVCMEDYDKANLEHEQLVIVVTSTFGSGDPPSNGEAFGRYLLDLRNGAVAPPGSVTTPTPRSHRMSTIVAPTIELLEKSASQPNSRPLSQVKYAAFGLGSRAYPNFCTFAHTCDNLLKDLGAEQIFPCGEGDELCGQEESFQDWLKNCYQKACNVYKVDARMDADDWEGYRHEYSKENFRVQLYERSTPEIDICTKLKKVHNKEVYPCVLKGRTKLQSSQSERSTILVSLDMNGFRMGYEPGDHVAIFPQNHPKLVNELLDCLHLPYGPDELIFVQSKRDSSGGLERWVDEKRMPVPVTLREAFTYYLDITNPPTPQFLKLLAKEATRPTEQEELNELAKGGDKYEDFKFNKFPNLIDVLHLFHSLKIDVTLLLQHLPLLQCRYYSISSSPKMYPNEIHATVAIVSFKKRNGLGPRHNGVCSTWLNKLEVGSTIPCVIRKAHAFRLPADSRTPVIMVGPGTGIAPYRSFWQHRQYLRNETLKLQLRQPSNVPQPKVALLKPKEPQGRKRRQTEFKPPNLNQLLQPPISYEAPEKGGGMPMRRSLSDADNTQEIAHMLATKRKALGNLSLYFGCRRHDLDFIYKDEIKKMQVSGILTDVNVAFSREPGKSKLYVQHLLKQNADKIVKQLMEDRGHFYVCGDISMAADVCRTLQSIFEENAAMSSDQARRWIETMKDTGLYHEDIFGVTLKHQEVTTRVRTAVKKQYRILVSDESNKPLRSPMTPYARVPSPMHQPAVLSFAQTAHPLNPTNFGSSSPGRSRAVKRPTVTVLSPQTPSSSDLKPPPKPLRPSAPEMPSPPTHRIRENHDIAEENGSVLAQKTGGIITEEEPSILDTVQEDSEPIVGVDDPRVKPDKQDRGSEEASGSDGISSAEQGECGKSSPSEQEVVYRDMPKEKKKARRIRTNSRVETVI